MLNVLFFDPYHSGSHRAFAKTFAERSRHRITLCTLPGQKWKARMTFAAWDFAEQLRNQPADFINKIDIILTTEMQNAAELRGLLPAPLRNKPLAVYFHENQFSYPWSTATPNAQNEQFHYAAINVASLLAADAVAFNSNYNRSDCIAGIRHGLARLRQSGIENIADSIQKKSVVIPVGIDCDALDQARCETQKHQNPPLLLWNHRWEFDKNPGTLIEGLKTLVLQNIDFEIAIVGQKFRDHPAILDEAPQILGHRLVAFGPQPLDEYRRLLWRANAVISTAHQEFLGLSVLEAMYCGAAPILPNRLSYPELLPSEFHEKCLYKNDNDFSEFLKNWILNPVKFEACAPFIERFSWHHVTPALDDWLESIANENA